MLRQLFALAVCICANTASSSITSVINIQLKPASSTSIDKLDHKTSISLTTDELRVIAGYRYERSVKPTHSGLIVLGGRDVVYYCVKAKNRLQLEEIGLDLNSDRVFNRSEVAQILRDRKSPNGEQTYEFKWTSNPFVLVKATPVKTIRGGPEWWTISVGPASMMSGKARFGSKGVDVYYLDSNCDGQFDSRDDIHFIGQTYRIRRVGGLVPMPDGRYYRSSLTAGKILMFKQDTRPLGAISVKNAKLRAIFVNSGKDTIEAALRDGIGYVPYGKYRWSYMELIAIGRKSSRYVLGIGNTRNLYFPIGPSKNATINIRPVSKLVLNVSSSVRGWQFKFDPQMPDGYSVSQLKIVKKNKEVYPPAPVADILGPNGRPVGKVVFSYG